MEGKTNHCVYNINYHIVFCPKYRHKVITIGYYIGTAGNVSAETIRKYIEAQKSPRKEVKPNKPVQKQRG